MTNSEKMSFWKGGDSADVLRFNKPYENSVIGVSTDGRIVYDFTKAIESVLEAERDNYNVEDFESEDEMEYAIMDKASEEITFNLFCLNPRDKIPVFCRTDVDAQDEEYMIHDTPYDFSSCALGPDAWENRYIFSLSKMVNYLIEHEGFEKKEAIIYVYNLKKAGTVQDGIYNYVIVDDLFEKIEIYPEIYPETYQRLNDKYLPEFEKNCIEIKAGDFINVITKMQPFFYEDSKPYEFKKNVHIRKSDENENFVVFEITDAKALIVATLELQNKSALNKEIFIGNNFLEFLKDKISAEENVKIFEGNGYLFVKNGEALYSTRFYTIKYPDVRKVIPADNNYSAQINSKLLKKFLDKIDSVLDKNPDSEKQLEPVKLTFDENKVTFEWCDLTEASDCSNNCEKGFNILLSPFYLSMITNAFPENFKLTLKESLKAVLINQDNFIVVVMPKKPVAD